jgi:hypothetical protein
MLPFSLAKRLKLGLWMEGRHSNDRDYKYNTRCLVCQHLFLVDGTLKGVTGCSTLAQYKVIGANLHRKWNGT